MAPRIAFAGDIHGDLHGLFRRLTPELHCQETYDLILRHRPARVFCGHMHWPLSARIGDTQIECLAHIDDEGSVMVTESAG